MVNLRPADPRCGAHLRGGAGATHPVRADRCDRGGARRDCPETTRTPTACRTGLPVGTRRSLCHRDDHGNDPLARRRPPIRHRRHRIQPRPVRLPRPPTTPTRLATPPRHRHGRLLHRPTHRLLRRQRTLPAPVGPATPPHLLAPAQPHRNTAHLAGTAPLRQSHNRRAKPPSVACSRC